MSKVAVGQSKITVPSLDRMFRARSVAIIGASPKPGQRNRILKVLMKHGYDGTIYPVSQSADEIEGFRAYKTVGDLPEVPDLAVVITPAATVPGLIEECGEKGITCAMVLSAGFEEIDSGKEHARKLKEAAAQYGVTVLGPNSVGLWAIAEKAFFSFSAAALAIENITHSPIALISQSGALAGAIGAALARNGLGCSYMVSVGNETCLDALDVLAWIVEQDDVKVVGLYLEGLDDGARLMHLAARARERNVQIVALKSGRSVFGQDATASHTGKIASPVEIYRNVLDQVGVVMVDSLGEFMAALEVYSFLPDPRISGDPQGGIAVMSSSGGAAALQADHSEEFGLPMSTFSYTVAAKLETILPEFARKANPVDLTGQIRSDPNLFKNTLAALTEDPRTEAIVVQFASSGMRDLVEQGDHFKKAVRDSGVPMIVTFAQEQVDVELKVEFMKAGIMCTDDPFNTMRALKWLYRRQAYRSIKTAPIGSSVPDILMPKTWPEMMSYLEKGGVTPANWKTLSAGETAYKVLKEMTYPLVVKVLPDAAEHKTEMGLVRLKVQTPDEVDAHAADFRRILGRPDLPVLVQEMVSDGVEVVLSCLGSTDFGPVLSIGSGGIAIELYRDVTYLALPVTPEQVEAGLKKTKLWDLLQGFRGAPKADVDALVSATVSFGNLILRTSDLAEAEINPVMVRPEGGGLAAVDFLGSTNAGR